MSLKSETLLLNNASIRELKKWIEQQDFLPPLLILLEGDLGAGKTEWVRQFVAAHGGDALQVSSPTYSLHNVYQLDDGTRVDHWDLYRLKDIEELDGIGFWEYLSNATFVIVEWPQIMGSLNASVQTLRLRIEKQTSETVAIYAAR